MSIFLFIVALLAASTAIYFFLELKRSRTDFDELSRKASSVLDVVAERERVRKELEDGRAQIAGARFKVQQEAEKIKADAALDASKVREEADRTRIQTEVVQQTLARLREEEKLLEESADLRSFGFYKPRYDFPDASRYSIELERIRGQQKSMIQSKTAAVCAIEWTVNGSAVEGRKQINQTLRLLLRAFNGECDSAIAKVKYSNITVMETRIDKAYEAINRLAEVQRCEIAYDYLCLKLKELYLAHEYQEKVQEEKEEQRRIREQMREEEVAQRELDRAREDAIQEEIRYERALSRARAEVEFAVGEKQSKLFSKIEELERLLAEAREKKERAISRAQMTRSGHVYIISNIGSFGEQVYKIGLTRRLDPMDRVRELGDASVPFSFDVHAIIFSEDAPTLENAFHKAFNRRRLNRINARKEFFRTDLSEIEAVAKAHGATIEFTLVADAKEYRQTCALLEDEKENGHAELPQSVPPQFHLSHADIPLSPQVQSETSVS